MPKQLVEKRREYFALSVATKKGTTAGGFGEFMNKLVGAQIKLRGLSAFVVGRRTKVFCVPEDVDAFKAFAKKRGLRLTQRSVLVYTGDSWGTMAMVNKWAISGELPPAFGFSNRGESFVYRDFYMGPG